LANAAEHASRPANDRQRKEKAARAAKRAIQAGVTVLRQLCQGLRASSQAARKFVRAVLKTNDSLN